MGALRGRGAGELASGGVERETRHVGRQAVGQRAVAAGGLRQRQRVDGGADRVGPVARPGRIAETREPVHLAGSGGTPGDAARGDGAVRDRAAAGARARVAGAVAQLDVAAVVQGDGRAAGRRRDASAGGHRRNERTGRGHAGQRVVHPIGGLGDLAVAGIALALVIVIVLPVNGPAPADPVPVRIVAAGAAGGKPAARAGREVQVGAALVAVVVLERQPARVSANARVAVTAHGGDGGASGLHRLGEPLAVHGIEREPPAARFVDQAAAEEALAERLHIRRRRPPHGGGGEIVPVPGRGGDDVQHLQRPIRRHRQPPLAGARAQPAGQGAVARAGAAGAGIPAPRCLGTAFDPVDPPHPVALVRGGKIVGPPVDGGIGEIDRTAGGKEQEPAAAIFGYRECVRRAGIRAAPARLQEQADIACPVRRRRLLR